MEVDREGDRENDDKNFTNEFTQLMKEVAFGRPNAKYLFCVFDYFLLCHGVFYGRRKLKLPRKMKVILIPYFMKSVHKPSAHTDPMEGSVFGSICV